MGKIVVTPLEKRLMTPLVKRGRRFWLLLATLIAVIAWGTYAWTVQLREGLAVTAMRDRVSWGLYISTFVFFIGVSYGGTLVSAILRLTGAEWRRPITRLAEAITVASLLVSATMILADLGRPERALSLFWYPQVESPLVWDMTAIGLYLLGSLIFLYLPLIPDLATLRAKMPRRFRLRRRLYGLLAARWRGLPEQRRALEKAAVVMTVMIIPLAISAHTVTAWIFGMTLRAGWHSALLGPYFVVGAILSGIATVVLVMAVARRALHLQSLIRPSHFRNLGLLLLVLDIGLLYFTLSEYLTALYAGETQDVTWVALLTYGPYAALFWAMILGGFIAPAFILALTRARSVPWTVVAAILVNVGMWMERYLIVVGSLGTPQMPGGIPVYWPSWVEWSVMGASIAGFGLILVVFSKLFPMVSMWEVAEHAPAPKPEATAEEVKA